MDNTDRVELTPCAFCPIARGELDADVVAFRDSHTLVIPSLHQRPQNPGHMLVLPMSHIPYIYDLDAVVGAALIRTVAAVARALKRSFVAHGIAVRQNNERHGGQDVFHVHFHVIPRFEDDGFNDGEDRFPFGGIEIRREVRLEQAARLRAELAALGT